MSLVACGLLLGAHDARMGPIVKPACHDLERHVPDALGVGRFAAWQAEDDARKRCAKGVLIRRCIREAAGDGLPGPVECTTKDLQPLRTVRRRYRGEELMHLGHDGLPVIAQRHRKEPRGWPACRPQLPGRIRPTGGRSRYGGHKGCRARSAARRGYWHHRREIRSPARLPIDQDVRGADGRDPGCLRPGPRPRPLRNWL